MGLWGWFCLCWFSPQVDGISGELSDPLPLGELHELVAMVGEGQENDEEGGKLVLANVVVFAEDGDLGEQPHCHIPACDPREHPQSENKVSLFGGLHIFFLPLLRQSDVLDLSLLRLLHLLYNFYKSSYNQLSKLFTLYPYKYFYLPSFFLLPYTHFLFLI